MKSGFELLSSLEININKYNEGEWGSAVGSFKVYPSIIKSFRVNLISIIDDRASITKYDKGSRQTDSLGNNSIPYVDTSTLADKALYPFNVIPNTFDNIGVNTNKDSKYYGTKNWEERDYDTLVELLKKQNHPELVKNIYVVQQDVFDVTRCFQEVGITYLTAIISSYEIIRSFKDFSKFDNDTIMYTRKAIFNAIEYAAKNKQFWENINGSSISTPNWSLNVDSTGWLLTNDMYGKKANTNLDNAGFEQYELMPDSKFYQVETKNGNVYNIVNTVKLDDLSESSEWFKGGTDVK